MHHVTVIIVNWQKPQDTIECVQSVQRTKHVNIHIVVIDNGSLDNSAQLIQQNCLEVELITLPRNLGFCGGYNTGIQHALKSGTDYLFLLNNDAIIDPGTIPALVSSPWDMAVPKIYYYDEPNRIWAAGAKWRWFPPSVKMVGHKKLDGAAYQTAYPLDYATGCAFMVSTPLIEKVGGFDPLYENYMEDYDFSYRVKRSGFSIGYVPQANVYHKVSQSLGAQSPKVWYFMGRNTVLFYRKNQRFPGFMLSIYLAWVTLREIVKGNYKVLPSFWHGVNIGKNILKE